MVDYRTINLQDMEAKQVYKWLAGTIGPRPIAWLSTQNEEGLVNLAPFSFFSVVSYEPPIVSVSILRKKGQMKDTARNLVLNGQVVLHLVDQDNVDLANLTAANLPENQSEAETYRIELEASKLVQAPTISKTKVRMECLMVHHLPIVNADDEVATDLFLLKVQSISYREDIVQDTYIKYQALDLVGRLAGNDYARLGSIFQVKRPN